MLEGKTSYLFSSYVMVNFFLILAYPILRTTTSAGYRSLKHEDNFGFTYQNSIIYTALALSMVSYTRSSSNSQFFIDFLTVGKIGVACLLFMAKFEYCLYYLVVCIVSWLVVPYPKFRGKNKFHRVTSAEEFEQLLEKKIQKKNQQNNFLHYQYKGKMMYFVEFYADWMLNCTFTKQIWYGFSNKYSTQFVKFLSINVSKFPKLAEKYRINTSGFSKQLPTIIVFEDGEQAIRFPPVDDAGKVPKVIKYDYKILLRYFDFQSRYLQTRF